MKIHTEGLERVVIPAGEYPVGCEEMQVPGEYFEWSPAHLTQVKSFAVSVLPVTRIQFVSTLKQHGLEVPGVVMEEDCWGAKGTLPVTGITVREAELFCNLVGGRLPTEDEWEVAFRGPAALALPVTNNTCPNLFDWRAPHKLPLGHFGVRGGIHYVDEWTGTSLGGFQVAKGTPYNMKVSHLGRRFTLRPNARWLITGFRVAWDLE